MWLTYSLSKPPLVFPSPSLFFHWPCAPILCLFPFSLPLTFLYFPLPRLCTVSCWPCAPILCFFSILPPPLSLISISPYLGCVQFPVDHVLLSFVSSPSSPRPPLSFSLFLLTSAAYSFPLIVCSDPLSFFEPQWRWNCSKWYVSFRGPPVTSVNRLKRSIVS